MIILTLYVQHILLKLIVSVSLSLCLCLCLYLLVTFSSILCLSNRFSSIFPVLVFASPPSVFSWCMSSVYTTRLCFNCLCSSIYVFACVLRFLSVCLHLCLSLFLSISFSLTLSLSLSPLIVFIPSSQNLNSTSITGLRSAITMAADSDSLATAANRLS